MSLANECTLLISMYHLLVFINEAIEASTKYMCGYSMASIVFCVIVYNIIEVTIPSIAYCLRKCKLRKLKMERDQRMKQIQKDK